ncbi:hypothetical protein CKAN_00254600 [Cinnamomum micranthum f. kanehirae]|uniref:Neprosin PEP catalytic domain-containing protein n=1 Tax=Cinnamomum micranthum f. kanehirae TaxID=337451 RepID=A0A3S4N985_9MAGN|nr:hypothetical protein CKAN_00254600 [Cinnamomum micranthum f. kanehirae]
MTKQHIDDQNTFGSFSLQTEYGDIFDCVDIYKQLAFDHPLLKNHTLLATQGTFYGTKVTMDLWTPQVSSDRMFSLSQYLIIGGPVESFSSIESGWMDANGSWWLYYNDYALGYFPRDLLPGLGSGPATSVGWGGETYSPTNVCPPMGSGHFPDEGVRKAGFMRGIKVMNQTRQPEDAPLNTSTIVDIPQNYRVVDPKVISPEPDGRSFFYGGPGGNC